MNHDKRIILSLYPNNRGVGYICLEMPKQLVEFGVANTRPISNTKILTRVEKFIAIFKPNLIIIRDCESPGWWRSKRVRKVVDAITQVAVASNLPVHHYSRQQIRFVFEQFGATSKYEIAQEILKSFPELAHRAPKYRKAWMNEDYNMGIFDALSLVVTHKYLTE